MKKILAFVLTLVMICSLCACGKGGDENTAPGEPLVTDGSTATTELNETSSTNETEDTQATVAPTEETEVEESIENNYIELKPNPDIEIPKLTITSVDADNCLWSQDMDSNNEKPPRIVKTYNINAGDNPYYTHVKTATLLDDHKNWTDSGMGWSLKTADNLLVLHESTKYDDDSNVLTTFYNGDAMGCQYGYSIGFEKNYKYYDTVYLDTAEIEYDKPIPVAVRGFSNTKEAKGLTMNDCLNLDEFFTKKYDKMQVLYILLLLRQNHQFYWWM